MLLRRAVAQLLVTPLHHPRRLADSLSDDVMLMSSSNGLYQLSTHTRNAHVRFISACHQQTKTANQEGGEHKRMSVLDLCSCNKSPCLTRYKHGPPAQ